MEKKVTSHITKGLVIALVLVILDLIAGFAGFRLKPWFRWIPSIILLAGVIWACLNFGDQNDHDVTFGNVFAHGFKTSGVVACIFFLYTLLSIYLIFPESRDIALQMTREELEKNQKLTQDNIDQTLEITKRLFVPIAIAGAVLGTLIVGVIAALIGAGVTKKNPVSPFDKQV